MKIFAYFLLPTIQVRLLKEVPTLKIEDLPEDKKAEEGKAKVE